MKCVTRLAKKISRWLTFEPKPKQATPFCNFERLKYEVRPGDVLLIESRSRVSSVVRTITQSPWTHACLYIGRLHDVKDKNLGNYLQEENSENIPLVIESQLGKGTVVTPLSHYKGEHIRICRPHGITPQDVEHVIDHAVGELGKRYNVRQILDLARFFFPWTIMPRRWRSSLFQHHAGDATKTVCSTLLAEAFSSVKFPILPIIRLQEDKEVQFVRRNPKLYTPSDFDYSPYFSIIKYPLFDMDEMAIYRKLPWSDEIQIHVDKNHYHVAHTQKPATD